jgi:hypothetical protein
MAFLARHAVITVAIGLWLFCTSCEKHPLPEEREVQTEHAAPEKTSSEPSKIEAKKALSSPTPAEFVPANPRP